MVICLKNFEKTENLGNFGVRFKFGHFGRKKSGRKNENLSAKTKSNSATLAEFGHSWEHCKCYCHVSMLDCKKREIWEWAEERVGTVEMSFLIDSRLQASFQQIAFKWDKK